MPTRRTFVKLGILAGVGVVAASTEALIILRFFVTPDVQVPLSGSKIPKFVDSLPIFAGARVQSASPTVQIQEFQQKLLPQSAYDGLSAPYNNGTYVWGYQVDSKPAATPGYTIEALRGVPTTITYINKLPRPSDSRLLPQLTIDQTIHWSDPQNQMGSTQPYQGSIPTVTHMHGAEVASSSDGGPEQWFTTDGLHGKGYATAASASANAAVYHYTNGQPATTLWFHDHALGMTRINVFSGLAAFYLLRDQFDTGLPNNPLKLPAGLQEIELVIQDRQFDTNGQLLFPNGTPAKNPTGLNGPPPNPGIHPYWIPEFFGDAILVNGKAWPYLEVEPRRYRFRFLNGSNARFYNMHLQDATNKSAGPAFWQIGTDGGLLDVPVELNNPHAASPLRLFMAPAERADIIIDFTSYAGRTFTLVNDAHAPYPDGDTPDPANNGSIMQFRVNRPLSGKDTTYDPASAIPLRGGANQEPAITRLIDIATHAVNPNVTIAAKRQLVLVEVEAPGGPVEVLLNNTKWRGIKEGSSQPIVGSKADAQGQGIYVTELPRLGTTEIWEIINLTEDAHPIHVHLIQFQLMNRQKFNVDKYRAHYDSMFPGGTYDGLLANGTKWGTVTYKPGTYIPGFGPPLTYTNLNGGNALGGNPDVTPYLQAGTLAPDANELGWKDTIKMYPGQVTRIVMRWAPIATPLNGVTAGQNLYPFDPTTGPGYVWHCHILDHEDNEMMRPYTPIN